MERIFILFFFDLIHSSFSPLQNVTGE